MFINLRKNIKYIEYKKITASLTSIILNSHFLHSICKKKKGYRNNYITAHTTCIKVCHRI